MSDSLLNHSWPSFSKCWKKRWSFKRGSEGKPCLQEFTDRSIAASEYRNPKNFLPPLIAGNDSFFTCMAEEKEDSSSVELDVPTADLHSSTEDLLSESALHGTEYYRDLGFLSLPVTSTAPETASQPEQAPQVVSAFRLLEERPGILSKMSVDVAFSNPVSCSVRYGEADCHFLNRDRVSSCTAVPQEGTGTSECPAELGKVLELQEAEETFPTLVRSMSTSRRHSWESPTSPQDCKRRFSLDATEMGSDPEHEDMASRVPSTAQRGAGSLEQQWGGTVIKVEIEPLRPSLAVGPSFEEVECGSNGKRLRSKSVPSACDKVASPQIPCSFDTPLSAVEGVEPPALEMLEKDHVSPDQVLIVQQVLQELKQYHGAKQRACVQESSDASQQNLTWFEFLSNENEDSGKTDKAERGTKVMRRLSSLRSRVTGSWQKDKGKNKEQTKEKEKEKEPKEPKERWKEINGHQLVPGVFSSCTSCSLCAKPLVNKSGLQCLKFMQQDLDESQESPDRRRALQTGCAVEGSQGYVMEYI
ncbi:rho guanine nucleotide exchange factor 18-like [Rhea pennata]|uniref:rho guanine nucleotide exchange factor 18-like n=1 Tax=Rhea pennata TaxID=8795 RepID=UPI002E269007